MTATNTIFAWHFTCGNVLRDNRPLPPAGVPLRHPDPLPLTLCHQGLHASLRPFDALEYAPGETLHLVQCAAGSGEILHDPDGTKLVTRERTIVASMDATPLLRHFARQQALSVLHHWPDPPDVVLDFLMGDDAARAAAWDAARDAARDAAWDAARASAEAAARAAARAAAWAAAEAAACAAARAAARGAAWAAAWAAARDAARDAARQEFNALVYDAFADWL